MTISFLYQMQDQIWNLHYEPSVFPFAFVFMSISGIYRQLVFLKMM